MMPSGLSGLRLGEYNFQRKAGVTDSAITCEGSLTKQSKWLHFGKWWILKFGISLILGRECQHISASVDYTFLDLSVAVLQL